MEKILAVRTRPIRRRSPAWIAVAAAVWLLLHACAARAPLPEGLIEVPPDELEQWWIPVARGFLPDSCYRSCEPGYVVVSVVIGSDGQVVNSRIVESLPFGLYDQDVKAALHASRYQPGPENPSRKPVRSTLSFDIRPRFQGPFIFPGGHGGM